MSSARGWPIVVVLALVGCDGKDDEAARSGASARPGSSAEAAGAEGGEAAGAARPEKLRELAELYAEATIEPEADVAGILSPHGAKYQVQALRAAAGDEKALGVLMEAEVERPDLPAHAANLERLLLGFGDEAFAAALASRPPDAITRVLQALELAAKEHSRDDPGPYRTTHPKTFALEPTAPK